MAAEVCPPDYIAHLRACYLFGSHMSYDGAKAMCENDGARLVDIDSINNKYVRNTVKLSGGNDFWIGSYINKGNTVRQKGTAGCPMMRGQDTGSGFFAQVNCNSAYPFICQKYGERKPKPTSPTIRNRFPDEERPVRYDDEDYSDEVEREIAITTAPPPILTTAAESGNSNNKVVAALVSVVALIVLAILIRLYFKRKNASKRKQEKELERKLTATGNVGKQTYPQKTDRTMSRTTTLKSTASSTVHKSFTLPSTTNMVSQHNVKTPVPDSRDVVASPYYSSKRERSRSNHSKHYSESPYHQRRRQTPSPERSLHGTHMHTPPYERSRSRDLRSRRHDVYRSQRNYRRSCSHSRRRSDFDLDKSRWSSRSSSLDSTISDSAMSRATAYRGSRRGQEMSGGNRRELSRDDGSYYPDDEKRHFSRQSSRRASEHRYKSLYERYAASQLPMTAREVMTLNACNNGMDNYYGRSIRQNHVEQRQEYPVDTRRRPPSYFPQMTNVLSWSSEEINKLGNGVSSSHLCKSKGRSLLPTQRPIRVNRHIHDFRAMPAPPKDDRKSGDESNDSDHVYESLDEVSRNQTRK